jgi:hypothetical protein
VAPTTNFANLNLFHLRSQQPVVFIFYENRMVVDRPPPGTTQPQTSIPRTSPAISYLKTNRIHNKQHVPDTNP